MFQKSFLHSSPRMRSAILVITVLASLLLFSCSGPMGGKLPFAANQTSTASQTALPPTKTLTPLPTKTLTPSPTVFKVPTATTTPDIFQPGDPTATPLGTDITDLNFIAGKQAYNDEEYEEVVALMGAVIDANPNLAPPYRYRGIAYWYLGDCFSGLADMETALALDPEYAKAWADRGLLYACLGDNSQMLLDYQKALSLDPSLAFVHHNLGVYYSGLSNYAIALAEYSQAVAIDPNRASTWAGRAYCETKLKMHPVAIESYKASLALDDQDHTVWLNYSYSQIETGDYEGALISSGHALAIDPTDYRAYINRGVAYYSLGEYSKALSDYNAALAIGDIPAAYSGRGNTYFELKMYNEAIRDYKKALDMMPFYACSHYHLSVSYFEIGKYQKSIDFAESSRQLDPTCNRQKLFETEGRAYYALGNYDQGILYMTKALQVAPYGLGYYYRGIIYQAAGKNEEATWDLKRFLSIVTSDEFAREIADAEARLSQLDGE